MINIQKCKIKATRVLNNLAQRRVIVLQQTKTFILQKNFLHRPGIEPGALAWKASMLPLHQRCDEYNR